MFQKSRILLLLLLFCSSLSPGQATALDIMLPQVYEENLVVTGWLMSEKLDGVRGYWDGKELLSKHGNLFHPPTEFTKNFPPFAIEGEIWGGRGTFEQTISIIKRKSPNKDWLNLHFAIFDVPETSGTFVTRLKKASKWFTKNHSDYAFVILQKTLTGREELKNELQRIESLGGEGLIVRRPDTLYRKGRSPDILKVKSSKDEEAVIKAHIPGTGRNQGRLGSVLVELPNGKQFKIGTGFSDKERESPPAVGAVITFKYYGLYQSGIPKFPSFLRVRRDLGL